jgi:hypothetical protein
MNKTQQAQLRDDLFRHLDGLVTAPTAYALHQKGVTDYLLREKSALLADLTAHFNANEGYLNVALRVLASQGWLTHTIEAEDQIRISVNDLSEQAFGMIPFYRDVVHLNRLSGNFHRRKFEKEPFLVLERLAADYQNRFGMPSSDNAETQRLQHQVLKHVEGMIVGPTLVALGMNGMFHKYFMEASFKPEEFHQDPESFERLLDIFTFLGWFDKRNGTYSFTQKGLFFARRASAYGVTVSYLPMFRQVDELIFGNPNIFWDLPPGAREMHVDREMNVWGSGGAHANYFKVVDDIIIHLFNQPIEAQPKGIVDMGCGNGAFLIHLFDVIEQRTLRGTMLEEYPLFLVGADYNQAALKVSRAHIIQADIWAKIIWGDIGRPDLLADDLREHYGIELKDLLNVRTFLDHNRPWSEPVERTPGRRSNSTGAFVYRGRRLPNAEVEDNLREHFQKWAPYVSRFGLLLIELHTIPPALTAANLGKTAATAYDATHGFSDQYIVEIDVFKSVAEEAGLTPSEKHATRFPDSDWATVSVNLLEKIVNKKSASQAPGS